MPRDLPLGNGHLLVNFDDRYHLRDIYFPHVGRENHSAGHRFGLGVWLDGAFSWVHDSWQVDLRYAEDTLATHVTLSHPAGDLSIDCEDVVDFHEHALVRRFVVRNAAARPRAVRLFFHHDFHISETEVGDTAYYDPSRGAIIHYKAGRWFLMNAQREGAPAGFDQWAVGKKETDGQQGTWRDAEDGELSGNAVVQGAVDSVGAVHLALDAGASATVWYWMACGFSYADVATVHAVIAAKTPAALQARTEAYWRLWVNAEPNDLDGLGHDVAALFRRSLLTVRTQIDHHGGIVAATDYDITSFARDTYAYVWPRDGALVACALDDAGYDGVTRPFFEFLARVQTKEGYWMHKYNTDGTLASSWHPWWADGERQLPIQEDETGLPIWALWRHFDKFHDVEFIRPLYRSMIHAAAEFMASYVDANGLPKPSYDLWEERRGVHAWTVAATWAGLVAAARFFAAFGDEDGARRASQAAERMKDAAARYLWYEAEGRFIRSVAPSDSGGSYQPDLTVDASVAGLFLFGMFDASDQRVARTIEHLRAALWVPLSVGGMARYQHDAYQRRSSDPRVPGNPWFISTLWLARWHIAAAATAADLAPALDLLRWVAARALPSGVLAEQVDPETDAPVSVSPLTWSHAEVIQTVVAYAEKLAAFNVCPDCGQPLQRRDRATFLSQRLAAISSLVAAAPPG
ncbi:MAG TPA: glycoside hydrolase family 15 protein [Dehalococcoidia bacterium]|nr:glycoside hydrolase family 15 protein [Dehalococcoidia bacterium]